VVEQALTHQVQQEQEELVVVEQEVVDQEVHQGHREQQIQVAAVEEQVVVQLMLQEALGVQVLLLLEHQDLLICQYHQELTQLQHCPHQLEVVKLQHLQYLELIHLY
jgi:hypothetical protein